MLPNISAVKRSLHFSIFLFATFFRKQNISDLLTPGAKAAAPNAKLLNRCGSAGRGRTRTGPLDCPQETAEFMVGLSIIYTFPTIPTRPTAYLSLSRPSRCAPNTLHTERTRSERLIPPYNAHLRIQGTI